MKKNKVEELINLFNKNRVIAIVLKVLFVILPLFLLLLMIRRNNVFNFYPAPIFGDEMGYYRVTHSFINGGKNFGNYGVSYSENVAAKFGGFSAHGPKYTVFYGIFGLIFGWKPYTMLLINICLFIFALCLMVRFLKLDNVQWLLLILLIVSFFPLLYFYISGMVEMIQYIFIFVYSILLYKLLREKNKRNYIINYLFIFFLTFFRINYAVLYIPIILYFNEMKINKKSLCHLLVAILLSAFSYILISIFSAPYPSYLSELLNCLFRFRIGEMFSLLFKHSGGVLTDYFSLKSNTVVEKLFNFLYLAILMANICLCIIKRKKKENIYFYNTSILSMTFLIIIMLYEVTYFKSVRTMGAFLILSILLLIYYNKKVFASIIIVILFLCTYCIIGLDTFTINASINFMYSPLVSKQETIDVLNKRMKCGKTKNRWDNTLTVPNSYSYSSDIIYGLSPCIGINYILNDDFSKIDKSKYILVSDDKTVNKKLYKFVIETDLGKLYIKK